MPVRDSHFDLTKPRPNRRGFLAAITGALTLDPERLLWRPGAKLISIPKPSGQVFTFEHWVILELNRLTHEVILKQSPVVQFWQEMNRPISGGRFIATPLTYGNAERRRG